MPQIMAGRVTQVDINLVLAAGLAYTLIGALILLASHRALYRRASRIVAGYPKVLAALQAQRHDAWMGLILIVSGIGLQVLAACGYALAPAYWPYPTFVAVAALGVYALTRARAMQGGARAQPKAAAARASVHHIYETRRSAVLLEAARREAESRRARERALATRERKVVYLAQDWECRWWSEKLGVSPEVLKAAVRQVGPMPQDIERYLQAKLRTRSAIAV